MVRVTPDTAVGATPVLDDALVQGSKVPAMLSNTTTSIQEMCRVTPDNPVRVTPDTAVGVTPVSDHVVAQRSTVHAKLSNTNKSVQQSCQ